jgi:MFS family permease
MVPVGAGGIVMAATANATIQLAVPDGLRGRVMSVYTTVFSASTPIGGLAAGALATSIGILPTVALGGALTLVTGLGALVWWRRLSRDGLVTVGWGTVGQEAVHATQSTAPSTIAPFSPPNPNEVLSTRR